MKIEYLKHLKSQYEKELSAILKECTSESDHQINYALLNEKIEYRWETAKLDGFLIEEYLEIIKSTIPTHEERIKLCQQKN